MVYHIYSSLTGKPIGYVNTPEEVVEIFAVRPGEDGFTEDEAPFEGVPYVTPKDFITEDEKSDDEQPAE